MALTVLVSSSMMHVPMSVAQVTDQTFGGCIASLVESGLDRGKASQACFDTMSKQPQTQTLGQCVTDLKEQLGTPVTRAQRVCSALIEAQPKNNRPAQNPSPSFPQRQRPSASPQEVSTCMNKLMYERKLVCTRNRCSHFPSEGFGGWETQNVRTDISEQAAIQACGA